MIVDEVLEAIVVTTGGSGVTVAARRTPVGGWSGVSNRGVLGVTPSETEHMKERSSSS